jgi:hypothetical protein
MHLSWVVLAIGVHCYDDARPGPKRRLVPQPHGGPRSPAKVAANDRGSQVSRGRLRRVGAPVRYDDGCDLQSVDLLGQLG